MDAHLNRRTALAALAAPAVLALAAGNAPASLATRRLGGGHVRGKLTGSEAVVATLQAEGTPCVYGIPGAQENELWDAMKSLGLPYLLVTHEFSAAVMADACARVTGRPGVLCVVPGPGVTNALSGLGEALLDSVPVVAIVGDVAQGEKHRPFQVHSLDQTALLKPVTKGVFPVNHVAEIPDAIRAAFRLAASGEPGPTAVVIPYTMLIETHHYDSPPGPPPGSPFDEAACQAAIALLSDKKLKVGIYAGLGCMDACDLLVQAAELLQAPVATSVSGKGCIPETHPLAVGWGYGPQASFVAEETFAGKLFHGHGVDCVLAIGVRYSEVSTGFYSNPQTKRVIHVDANPDNIGRVLRTDVGVAADASVFLSHLVANADCLRRPPDAHLLGRIRHLKEKSAKSVTFFGECGADPLAVLLSLRRWLPPAGLFFVDVTASEHLAAEYFTVHHPRTYFNPTDNQAMGWSVPAAIGASRLDPSRPCVAFTGDGCLLMSAMEISTAAREGLPVKVFVLDDQAYHYMQELQKPAYLRTTATILARLDYAALAKGWGVGYAEVRSTAEVDAGVRDALACPGPMLVRVVTDYGKRKFRWIEAVRDKYVKELTAGQKARFLGRIGGRAVSPHAKQND